MKQVFTLIIGLFCCGLLYGQTENYPNGFTYKVLGIDTYSPFAEELHRFDKQTFGFSAEYNRYLNRSLSLSLPFRYGQMNYPYDVGDYHEGWSFYAQDFGVKYNFFTDANKKIQPYITTGVGFMYIKKAEQQWQTQLPIELGLNVQIIDGIFLQLSTSYRLSTGPDAWHNGIGLNFVFDSKKGTEGLTNQKSSSRTITTQSHSEVDPDYYLTILDDHHASTSETEDTDNDGVPNAIDLCPDEYGDETAGGCPIRDDDQDGMANFEDRCPTEPGLIEFGGCPDRDGDNIADIFDACPEQAGNRTCKGCPDRDSDSVPDELDKCPTEKGRADNNGCPSMSMSDISLKGGVRPIFFDKNSHTLDNNDFTNLNTIVKMMNRYPNAILSISGIAYDSEDGSYNEYLSIERAKKCYTYLLEKGVAAERLTYQGLGNTRMVTSEKLQKSVEFYMAF